VAAEILNEAQASRFVIQDFRPLPKSVEWRLGQAYLNRGSQAFAGDEPIPFAVNNDGNLAIDAAAILFESLVASEQGSPGETEIRVLEVGPGLGLFARYFLDVFQSLCRERGKAYCDRLTYVAADRSEKMLADIGRHGVFANHLGHYELRLVDALHPAECLRPNPDGSELPFHAIFLNYLLDALPAAPLKLDADGVKQLCVRTCLARGVRLSEYTDLSAEDLACSANSEDIASQRELAALFDLMASEYTYQPVVLDELPYGQFAVEFARSRKCEYVLHSYGALQSLERLLGILEPHGFILINDYGCGPKSKGISPISKGPPYNFGPGKDGTENRDRH
jgi:SAM-dependent methyltransferase